MSASPWRIATLLFLLVPMAIRGASLETGRTFPTLSLPRALDGTPDSLEHYRGSKVVVHVFASW